MRPWKSSLKSRKLRDEQLKSIEKIYLGDIEELERKLSVMEADKAKAEYEYNALGMLALGKKKELKNICENLSEQIGRLRSQLEDKKKRMDTEKKEIIHNIDREKADYIAMLENK